MPHQVRHDTGGGGAAQRRTGEGDDTGGHMGTKWGSRRRPYSRRCGNETVRAAEATRWGKDALSPRRRVRPTASLGSASGGPAGSAGPGGAGGGRPRGEAREDPSGALAAALGAGSLVIDFAQSPTKLKPVAAAQTVVFIDRHASHHPSSSHLITCFNRRSHGGGDQCRASRPTSCHHPADAASSAA